MAKLWANSGWMARALVLSGIVALFLAQALAIARPDSSRRDGSSFAAADRPCLSAASHDVADTEGGPAGGRHHCEMCPTACGGAAADAIVAPMRLGAVLPHAPPAIAASRPLEAPAVFRSGWRGSWSSRAPPFVA
ncbi:hypothetical protein EDE12_108131 [Methylosinus sp. sav-2]|uniref:hypothetical protein n=1 Tax=Methylosinus sp. sav-2 TaxID=2485168 RepID=UPI001064ACDE|nr:hypothetical protein [Methylosinus sp. sav-2]TDX63221.1 hypothetical protein EDE12_108131 [Methylosinus sp. sav-2]